VLDSMAPALVADDQPPAVSVDKPTVYLLDSFHPEVMAFCKKEFNAITISNPENANWRQNARYILVRTSYVTAEDIKASPNLLATAKQGVGIDKIDAEACKARGIRILNTPGANAQAVAEQVLTLTMAVARQVGRILIRQASGVLVPKEQCSGLTIQ